MSTVHKNGMGLLALRAALATERLRQLGYNDLIICGLSANAMKEYFDKAYACGMNDYVTKPITANELGKILVKYLPTLT
jgi:CheY-like chemotaxis protein